MIDIAIRPRLLCLGLIRQFSGLPRERADLQQCLRTYQDHLRLPLRGPHTRRPGQVAPESSRYLFAGGLAELRAAAALQRGGDAHGGGLC